MNTGPAPARRSPAGSHDLPSSAEGRWRPRCRGAEFREVAADLHVEGGLPLDLLFATDDRADGRGFGVHAVFALDRRARVARDS